MYNLYNIDYLYFFSTKGAFPFKMSFCTSGYGAWKPSIFFDFFKGIHVSTNTHMHMYIHTHAHIHKCTQKSPFGNEMGVDLHKIVSLLIALEQIAQKELLANKCLWSYALTALYSASWKLTLTTVPKAHCLPTGNLRQIMAAEKESQPENIAFFSSE